jgi:Ser/Thr protein kinase RdoA (MazF antagonist)
VICRPWLPEGHREPGQWGEGYLTAVGELLARMHAAGAAWEPPVRHRAWNFGRSASETVAGVARRHGSEISLPHQLGAAAARVDEALADPLARTNLHGPVHADCWYGNLLWDGDRLVAADFESCGIGPRAYDLAVWYDAFYGWSDGQGRSEQFDQVLAAYERLAPLDPAERTALPYLGALRHFWLLESELEGRAPRGQDEPAARRFYVEDHAAAIARLLATAARKP